MSQDEDEFEVPSAKDYKRSILAIRPIHDNHLELLKAHFLALNHTGHGDRVG